MKLFLDSFFAAWNWIIIIAGAGLAVVIAWFLLGQGFELVDYIKERKTND